MQTSSNFFNKSLFSSEDYLSPHTKNDKYLQNDILSGHLRPKEDLSPWTEINPQYNFKTQRLIKLKEKLNQEHQIQRHVDTEIPQAKQAKSDTISNLFNFYKSNKEKKRSTLKNSKQKSLQTNTVTEQSDNSFTLPSIDERQVLEEYLVQNKQSIHKNNEETIKQKFKQNKQKKNQSESQNYVQSISIRDYLMKLKQKEKVLASSSQTAQKRSIKQSTLKSELEGFTLSRHSKIKRKPLFGDSINAVEEVNISDISYRYSQIRNPQIKSYKKRTYLSPLQSLEQSFEIYKKAAQQQVQQAISNRKSSEKHSAQKLNSIILGDKPHWKNNVPMSYLLSSPILEKVKRYEEQSASSVKKYSTISYSRSFSPTQNCIQLPKIQKQHSVRQ